MKTTETHKIPRIKRPILTVCQLVCLFFVLISCSNDEEQIGKENTWTFFEYSYHSGEWITRSDSIQVVSGYDTQGDELLVLVMWQAMNLENEPAEYFFEFQNKYLVTGNGDYYAPSNGENARIVQPHAKIQPLRVGYRIPKSVNLDDLYWGHYDRYSESMRYKFKLEPEFIDM